VNISTRPGYQSAKTVAPVAAATRQPSRDLLSQPGRNPKPATLARWLLRALGACSRPGPFIVAMLLALGFAPVHAQGNRVAGEYIAKAAGCMGCHTDTKAGSVPFAGGRALETPFGIFYGPNITPHRETGLGIWSEEDFRRAVRRGERRDGSHYFPAFPYPSFTGMSDTDVRDLWAYLRSLPATNRANQEHALRFPFSWRPLVAVWKWLFFTAAPALSNAPTGASVARGSYLVRALGHCGECHTPRNFLGGPKSDRLLAGGKVPEGKVPNLTPTRLKKWTDAGLKEYLLTGMTPGGDIAAEPMGEVITNSTSRLTPDDLSAIVAYLRSLPPLPSQE